VGAAEALGGSGENRQTNPLRIFAHLRIPKSNNRPSLAFKPSGAPGISHDIVCLRMLSAIQFHRKHCFSASDINDEPAN
jgi:hypothetical protein